MAQGELAVFRSSVFFFVFLFFRKSLLSLSRLSRFKSTHEIWYRADRWQRARSLGLAERYTSGPSCICSHRLGVLASALSPFEFLPEITSTVTWSKRSIMSIIVRVSGRGLKPMCRLSSVDTVWNPCLTSAFPGHSDRPWRAKAGGRLTDGRAAMEATCHLPRFLSSSALSRHMHPPHVELAGHPHPVPFTSSLPSPIRRLSALATFASHPSLILSLSSVSGVSRPDPILFLDYFLICFLLSLFFVSSWTITLCSATSFRHLVSSSSYA